MSDLPFVLANNRIPQLLEALGTAARPARFTQEFLKSIGFASSNDRAFIPLFRKLGFITSDGTPTEAYDALREKKSRGSVLAERIRDLYSNLFAINTKIYNATDDDVKGAISRVTGKDATTVNRYFATFKALASQAKFDPPVEEAKPAEKPLEEREVDPPPPHPRPRGEPGFHYNIQIHLPATTDIAVYNAIFRSLRENLNI